MKKTPLYDAHIKSGAKMGEFAGYDMPLYYEMGLVKEHEWVRSKCGIFDVSHMGQVMLFDRGAGKFLEQLTPSSFTDLAEGKAKYTVLMNDKGGIIDDLIISKVPGDCYFAVINAGRKDVDLELFRDKLPDDVDMNHMKHESLIAVQGPEAEKVLSEVLEIDLSDVGYMEVIETKLLDEVTNIYVSRLGYTGEDGFEVSVAEELAEELWEALMSHDDVKPIGLAARDSLRLEMGYPLYGHDMDETISPVEAGLGWVISKNNDCYFGRDVIEKQRKGGLSRKRVGVKILGKGIAREGAEIFDMDENKIGDITSGGHSPSLGYGIAMGYVFFDKAKIGEQVNLVVRGRKILAEIVKMPFVEAKTKK